MQLGAAKPGFTGWSANSLRKGEFVFGAQTHDIEKAVFDINQVNGGGRFSDRSKLNSAIPMVYQVRSDSVTAANSPAKLLKANPAADIMIVSLILTKPAK